ncbi:flagellar protein FlgN [Paenibacillus sp. NEAU-GSW1]|uniref:flagellar protein FlgN n=1 Tax=Paenibacillus sp. NEAU-GSW1 TaxID=2682486 RepID=UPI0012E24AD6|nr:flagellar protein FlgN [Paenibacillus sp. NEAU-GSW1]MUT65020.1 hypothetical protein [Paenibacillus sp. NEAU-GSW1]
MSIPQIIDTLEQQYKLYESLLEMEKSKKDLIIKNEVLQLNVLTQKEKLLVAKLEELEKVRSQLTFRYFRDIGFRIRTSILSEMIRSVTNPKEKEQLLELHGKLTAILAEMKHVNALNQQLINQSLAYLDFSINLMVEDPNQDYTYQHPMNNVYGSKRNGLFDNRA